MSGESRLMSRNPYYCIHGAPLDRRCEACATAPDPVDDAAVEAEPPGHFWKAEAEKLRLELAEARASLERTKVERNEAQNEVVRAWRERDEAVEARENANALSIRLEGERDRAVERAEAAEVERDELQAAVDRAHAAMLGSEYVGGPTEREAWRTAFGALAEVVTQHQAQGEFSGAPEEEER